VRIALVLLFLACRSTEPTSVIETTVKIEPAAKAPETVLAETILAAVASGDVDALRPAFGSGWADLAEVTRDNVRTLRRKLIALNIDLSTAKLLRVTGSGAEIEMFDVLLESNGRRFKTHFSALRSGELLSIAGSIVPEDQND